MHDDFRMPALPAIKSVPQMAWEALRKEVDVFQRSISKKREIGISVNGAQSIIHVRSIHQSGQMIVFEGVDDLGRRARLIQHYSQVNVQMLEVDPIEDIPQRIGF